MVISCFTLARLFYSNAVGAGNAAAKFFGAKLIRFGQILRQR